MRQWEIWKSRPPGFQHDHWFVLISGNERIADTQSLVVNGLACFKTQGIIDDADVFLNSAEGFSGPTSCQCDFLYTLEKRSLHSPLGTVVSAERQRQIKAKLKDHLRLH